MREVTADRVKLARHAFDVVHSAAKANAQLVRKDSWWWAWLPACLSALREFVVEGNDGSGTSLERNDTATGWHEGYTEWVESGRRDSLVMRKKSTEQRDAEPQRS